MRLIYAARRVSEVTGSYDFIYSVTTLFAQLRLYLLRTFAEPGLDPEITLDQVLPRMPFGIHVMMDAEPLICDLKKKMASGGRKRWRAFYPESTTYEMLPRLGWKH